MLSAQDNLLLTQVGKGTPCGELLRRYWMPVAVAREISDEKPVKRVRLLGEDLVLFRDGAGRLGLIPEHCPHRRASLYFGFVEEDGLRCPYHGWKFNVDGACLEQPFERANGPLMKQAQRPSYPVQQLAGLIFAYLGPAPAPLLPRWEMLVRNDGVRTIVVLPPHRCNWLQAQENSLDPTHTYWLHARLFERALKGRPAEDRKPWAADLAYFSRPIESYEFEVCREPAWSGIRKVRTYGGEQPEKESGHPAIFPNILVAPQGPKLTMHFRVPVDDENLSIYWVEFQANVDRSAVEQTEEDIPVSWLEDPLQPDGEYRLDHFVYQDQMAWETQGRVFDRTSELIGMGDRGIVMFRDMLKQQIRLVQEGKDPDGVIRDAALNQIVQLSLDSGLNKLAHEMAGAK